MKIRIAHTCADRPHMPCDACEGDIALAKKLLQHAEWHCKFGSEPDNTIREATPADLEAAKLLNGLRASFGGVQ